VLTMDLVDQLCTRWQQLRDVGDRPWHAATLQAPIKKAAAPSGGELRDSQRLPARNKAEHSPWASKRRPTRLHELYRQDPFLVNPPIIPATRQTPPS
jgi:hypothetical protein